MKFIIITLTIVIIFLLYIIRKTTDSSYEVVKDYDRILDDYYDINLKIQNIEREHVRITDENTNLKKENLELKEKLKKKNTSKGLVVKVKKGDE